MKAFLKNIKEVLVFSDSELLELSICLVFFFINPVYQQSHGSSVFWWMLGVIGGVFILFGLGRKCGTKCLKTREIGLLIGLVNLVAINLIEARHYHFDPGYILQNIVVAFTWWKVSRQRFILGTRKRCQHGTN